MSLATAMGKSAASYGQGATEYLVLLAAVLIIALVSISLLSFFPHSANAVGESESDAYWSGQAYPLHLYKGYYEDRAVKCRGVLMPFILVPAENAGPDSVTITEVYTNGALVAFCDNANPGSLSTQPPASLSSGEKKNLVFG